MSTIDDFSAINRSKADFSAIYVQPDPRAYFRTLGALGYVIPHLARPVFDQLIEARRRARGGGPVTVLDLGCSYGVNAALMKYAVDYDQLAERYDTLTYQQLAPEEILRLDRHYFASWPKRHDIRVIGLDISREAIRYAEDCGILDAGIVADLESDEISPLAAQELAKVDLIVSTGCVGYVTNRTFEKLAVCTANGEAPWVASFVLRMFDYGDIAQTLKRQGLVTQKFEGATFVQRRFRDEAEMRGTLDALGQRNLSPAGKEADGLFHAELFFSRPKDETEAQPINRLVSVASGVNRNYGRRPRVPGRPVKTARPARPALPA
jgi:SAM-dependent methyltransferase